MLRRSDVANHRAGSLNDPNLPEKAVARPDPALPNAATTIAKLSLSGLLAHRFGSAIIQELPASLAVKTAEGKWSKVETEEKQGDSFTPSSLKTRYTTAPAADSKRSGLEQIPFLDARLHLIASGQNDEAMKSNFDYIFNQPVNKAVVELAQQKLEQFKSQIPVVEPEHLQLLKVPRRGGSETLKDENTHHKQAMLNWQCANDLIFQAARNSESVSPQTIHDLFIAVHSTLMRGVNETVGGLVRQYDNVWIGLCDSQGSRDPHPSRLAVPGSMVHAELNTLCTEVAEELNKGSSNPVLLAARTAMKGVSIHPFADGNGRTCRLIADFVLLKSGLLPACFDDETKNMMVFPRIAPDMNHNTTTAANLMLDALERSYKQVE
jgi:fido (protein-threonine AMPylation protein)